MVPVSQWFSKENHPTVGTRNRCVPVRNFRALTKRVMRGQEILDLIHGMVELTRNYVKQVGRSRVEDDAIPSDFRPAADGPVLFPSLLHFAARRRSARSSGRAGDFCGLRGRLSLARSSVGPPVAARRGIADGGPRSERPLAMSGRTDGGTERWTDGGGCDVAHGDGTTSLTAKKKSANI